jgi:hypothetical protein
LEKHALVKIEIDDEIQARTDNAGKRISPVKLPMTPSRTVILRSNAMALRCEAHLFFSAYRETLI